MLFVVGQSHVGNSNIKRFDKLMGLELCLMTAIGTKQNRQHIHYIWQIISKLGR
jgi:hypothetical protein